MKFLLELHSLHRWVSAGVLRASLRISCRLNVRCFLFPVCSAVAFSKSSSICTHWLWGSFFFSFLQLSKLRDWKTCSALVIFFAVVACCCWLGLLLTPSTAAECVVFCLLWKERLKRRSPIFTIFLRSCSLRETFKRMCIRASREQERRNKYEIK